MRTQATDSAAAVSRRALTSHLRPAGRLRTPVRPGSFHDDPAVRFLQQGLHLRPDSPPPAAPARPAPCGVRRLDIRRSEVLTLWTGHDRLAHVRDNRPACRRAEESWTPLQQREARDFGKQTGARSPVGGTWGSCSIVNAATPRSVATDPRGRGFPAPYQSFLRKGEQT